MDINKSEKEILEFWKKDKTFEKSLKQTEKGKPYIFYDGPPFATGLPHYGHLLASILKDVFPRFFTMKGRYVKRNWGWDCHGLPIENVAEKELKINSKDEIEKMGVKKFNDFCRANVLTFAKEWEKSIERVGRWVDFKEGYKTMDTEYIESIWWAFKELYEKGYLYQGEKILMYCPRCSTPLAKSEIAMDNSYKTTKDLSVVVKFKLENEKNTYAISWTTTPWTLPSNLALTVNPNMEYAFVEDKNDKNIYLLAKELIKNFYKSEEDYKIKKIVKGKELEGKTYEPLYGYFKGTKNAFKIILGDFVTAEEGTGIVHTAPAFGEEDNIICRKYQIPMVQPIDETGHFTNEVKDYAGEYIHEINERIVIDLKKAGKVIFSKKIDHEYPFCYRCETKLMYRALPAWFVDIQKIKKRLQELNLKVKWIPEFLKEGRMKNNIETAPDWNITRNRYWASAIPIWKSETGKIKVIGSIEELKKFAKKIPKEKIDLHRDFLDKIKLEIDGEEYKRIPEVLDCWFESGGMTFAQFHYPFENKEFFEKNFPADFVVEYIGQTRAWFYYMIVLSAILFNKIPFQNVLTTGTILAEDGQKMSKSKKNFPDPSKVIEKYGADSIRFYLLQSSVMNADNFNFSEKGLEESYRKVLVLLYNVSNFYSMYAEKKDEKFTEPKELIDKWIISKLNSLNKKVNENLEKYDTIKACTEIKNFIDELSTWYVRVSRERFNEGDREVGKILRRILNETSKITAPIIPFISENVYQSLNGKKRSVHLESWPEFDETKIDEKLEFQMAHVRNIVSEGLKQRDKNNAPLKWPLSKVEVFSKIKLPKDLKNLIIQELNVKKYFEVPSENKDLEMKIDFETTPELEAEGYAREISRKVQAFRKKIGLNKNDKIKLTLIIEKNFEEILESQKKFIKERTNSKEFNFSTSCEISRGEIEEFKVREKRGKIQIVRL
ncbi:isoleucine--tRNA ligase [Candidatus Pacearchaeota archaeon CG10_big_fil_rev_8_21_14_0_10_32_42]|nr:MAG: isoleucine--tRNA ligase [Candidatus Pacearchaeota archaeon CG10_big_fil_rev_8_21_14_0_10_32_42]